MADEIIFVAGFPRSGSTLLMNILGQNPQHHVTPTNDLAELLLGVRNYWHTDALQGFKAQGHELVQPRIENFLHQGMRGFYREEITKGQTIFDKSRGWLGVIDLMEQVLKKKVKVVVTIREMVDIVTSWEKIHRKNPLIRKPLKAGESNLDNSTIHSRALKVLDPTSPLGAHIDRFREAINKGYDDRMIIIPYDKLTTNPKGIMEQLHFILGLPEYKYNFDNVEQVTFENDEVYGMDLHNIDSKIEYRPSEAGEYLPLHTIDFINQHYNDINQYCRT